MYQPSLSTASHALQFKCLRFSFNVCEMRVKWFELSVKFGIQHNFSEQKHAFKSQNSVYEKHSQSFCWIP